MLYGTTVTDGIYHLRFGMGWRWGLSCVRFLAPRLVLCARLGNSCSLRMMIYMGWKDVMSTLTDGRHVFDVVIQLIEMRITSKVVQHVKNLRSAQYCTRCRLVTGALVSIYASLFYESDGNIYIPKG